MKNSGQTARKRSKAADPPCDQVIIIESPKRRCSGLGKKARPKKLKCLLKETSSNVPDPKKQQSDSQSEKEARASSPVVIESSSDLEPLRDTKKRNKVFKKGRDRKPFCIQIQNAEGLEEGRPGTDFHASKKGARAVLEVGRQDEESAMKKKKKKKDKRKEKPVGLQLLSRGDGASTQIPAELEPSCQEMSSGQRKSRALEQEVVGEGVEKSHFECYEGHPEKVSPKASREGEDAPSGDGSMQRRNDLARRSEKASGAVKKKKKKNKKPDKINLASLPCLAKIQDNHSDGMSERGLKWGLEKEAVVGKAPAEVKKAARKKPEIKAGDARLFPEAGQDIFSKVVGAPGRKGKRKKEKKRKMERDGRDGVEGSQGKQVKKKRKNKEMENSQDGGKKAKTKRETKKQVTEDEIKVVDFRKGNCDEVNIDKVRRQALQEEIDRESGKTKVAKDASDHYWGQWSTAMFETPEQKTKFHRLMGGFKKGLTAAQGPPADANKPNMALDRPGEQELKHKLEAEFEKAVEFKHHHGIGLGFQSSAPSGLHIDKHASKSIKFEA